MVILIEFYNPTALKILYYPTVACQDIMWHLGIYVMDMQHQYWVGGIYNLAWRRGVFIGKADMPEKHIC